MQFDTIHVGEAVKWRNEGRSPQTVTADPSLVSDQKLVSLPEGAEPWDSNVLNHGATFVQVFTAPGEYRYVSLPQAANGMTGLRRRAAGSASAPVRRALFVEGFNAFEAVFGGDQAVVGLDLETVAGEQVHLQAVVDGEASRTAP